MFGEKCEYWVAKDIPVNETDRYVYFWHRIKLLIKITRKKDFLSNKIILWIMNKYIKILYILMVKV